MALTILLYIKNEIYLLLLKQEFYFIFDIYLPNIPEICVSIEIYLLIFSEICVSVECKSDTIHAIDLTSQHDAFMIVSSQIK